MSLSDRLREADVLLAPYAVKNGTPDGREHPDPPDDRRFPFQRDRDRIVHTQAFRRLQGKTQVFMAGEGDHFRTRLTHTMEVAQIARDLARSLRLNEDLAECIALAHDLGHPPFGHAGEEALHAWMKTHGSSFEHNEQSLRLVTALERHAGAYPGLNLRLEVLDGLRKHTLKGGQHTLEAQLVNIADEIAYTAHDCEDALRAGIFSAADIAEFALIRAALERAEPRGTAIIGGIIKVLLEDLLRTTQERIDAAGIRTLDDVRNAAKPMASFSQQAAAMLAEWRDYLWRHMYLHPLVIAPMEEGQHLLLALCHALHQNPTPKMLSFQERTKSPLHEAVKDYVAGMTDAFAYETGREMNLPMA
jgi:dGTPase